MVSRYRSRNLRLLHIFVLFQPQVLRFPRKDAENYIYVFFF